MSDNRLSKKEKVRLWFLKEETVRSLFFVMLAALPFVNKFSKFTVVLFLVSFFLHLKTYKDFVLPKAHRYFLAGLSVVILIGNITHGAWSYLKQDMYLAFFIAVFYAVVYFFQKGTLSLKHLAYGVVIPMSIYVVDGFYQYATGYDLFFGNPLWNHGINSVSRNRNIFALAVFYLFMLSMYGLFEIKERKWFFMLLAAGSVVTIILTLSRQMWLSVGMFLFILLLFHHKRVDKRYLLLGIIGIAVLSIALFWSVPALQERVMLLRHFYSAGRTELWTQVLLEVPDAPIFGHGLHSPIVFEGMIPYWYSHNLTLDMLYYFGISGLVLYVVFIGYFVKLLWRCENISLKPYLTAGFATLLLLQQQLGGSMLIHKFVGPAMMIFLSVIVVCCAKERFIRPINDVSQEV